ncbi:MAG: sugar nucleotide-binding protein, partial [Pirellulaceae bacterium]|nr:sugar nucleotide-binding protein [Pirellulaceae bacterium]
MLRRARPIVDPPLPLLITGIAGVAGYNAMRYFEAKYPGRVIGIRQRDSDYLTGPGIVACNAEDRRGLARLFEEHRFASVLNCAGNCALKPCELDPALAWRINVDGILNLLSQTTARGIRLVHLSVDLVYSGRRGGGYVEDDPTDPLTVYGKTMAAAERLVLATAPDTCILRISLPMGVSPNGHAGAIDWIASRFKKSRPATLYFDEIRTP